MSYIYSSVVIELNSAGFRGTDIDALLPDFVTERKTTVGLTWYSSVNGPESFTVALAVGSFCAAAVASGFLEALGADMYKWAKHKLLSVLRSKRHPDCYISLKFDDMEMFFHEDGLFSEPNAGDVLLDFFEQLSNLVLQMDAHQSKTWEVSRDPTAGTWLIRPFVD
jgi:hypothetical protein